MQCDGPVPKLSKFWDRSLVMRDRYSYTMATNFNACSASTNTIQYKKELKIYPGADWGPRSQKFPVPLGTSQVSFTAVDHAE